MGNTKKMHQNASATKRYLRASSMRWRLQCVDKCILLCYPYILRSHPQCNIMIYVMYVMLALLLSQCSRTDRIGSTCPDFWFFEIWEHSHTWRDRGYITSGYDRLTRGSNALSFYEVRNWWTALFCHLQDDKPPTPLIPSISRDWWMK